MRRVARLLDGGYDDVSGIFPSDITDGCRGRPAFGIVRGMSSPPFAEAFGRAKHLVAIFGQTLPVPACNSSCLQSKHPSNIGDQISSAKEHLEGARSERDQTFYENKCASLDRQIDQLFMSCMA
ncbi:MAG: hypothetical protein ACR2H4_05450 [Pyrinomonadaceae bacterium]